MSDFFRWDVWFAWPTLLVVFATIGAVVVCFLEKRHHRIIGIFLLFMVVWPSAAVVTYFQNKPDRDFVYLFVPQSKYQNFNQAGEVQLWTQATAHLTDVDSCWLRTEDYPNNHPFWCHKPRFGWAIPEGDRPSSITVGMDDWTFDLDAANSSGQVRQRLRIAKDNGVVVVSFSQVIRKRTGEILCETPKRESYPLCR